MLTKEEYKDSLNELFVYSKYSANKVEIISLIKCYEKLEQLINEHFKLVKENERLSTQLVECQRVCQLKQERINELEKGTVSYVD